MLTRTRSTLDAETEKSVAAVLGSGLAVHRALGPGYLERVYHNALCVELTASGISFETEKRIIIRYRERVVGVHRIDLVACDSILVEIKATRSLEPVHQSQVISYLKATGYRIGLLMNFGGATLTPGVRRIVL